MRSYAEAGGTEAAVVPDVAGLPDDPSVVAQQGQASTSAAAGKQQPEQQPDGPQQTRRILGVMPNFNAVSADSMPPPQSPKEKFVIAAKNSFDYSSILLSAIQSGVSMATDSYPEFHQGVEGYGRYFYHTLLDTADENFMVSGLMPVVFRQDNRFYTRGHGSIGSRAFYAATRVLVTRSDAGRNVFNASEIVGAGAASGLSTVYYPDRYQTWTKVGQRWLTSCIIDSASLTFKEFWPDINQKFFHTK
ncbi:MAG TPA: hypothetical protein VFS41_08910 [Edaphobacter sp.]|nr:hypothetical protein [Edaphobacter sp.]